MSAGASAYECHKDAVPRAGSPLKRSGFSFGREARDGAGSECVIPTAAAKARRSRGSSICLQNWSRMSAAFFGCPLIAAQSWELVRRKKWNV